MTTSREFLRAACVWGALVAAVLTPFFLFERDVQAVITTCLAAADGRPLLVAGVLFAVLAGDVFLPVPSCLAGALCGALLGPWLGFAVSFAAMGTSAALGYLTGRFFASAAQRLVGSSAAELAATGTRWGPRLLLVMRPVPVLAECSTVYAGIRRWPVGACALWASLGNAVVSATYAALGAWGRTTDSPLPSFAAVAALSGVSFLIACRRSPGNATLR
jgi:3-dehydroquinate synthase